MFAALVAAVSVITLPTVAKANWLQQNGCPYPEETEELRFTIPQAKSVTNDITDHHGGSRTWNYEMNKGFRAMELGEYKIAMLIFSQAYEMTGGIQSAATQFSALNYAGVKGAQMVIDTMGASNPHTAKVAYICWGQIVGTNIIDTN